MIWDLAHFQNALWDQGELLDLWSHIAYAWAQYRTYSNTSPLFARYGTILGVPTTECPIFFSLLMVGIYYSLFPSPHFTSSLYTVHHFLSIHLCFRSSPYFSEVSPSLINPRIDHASKNLLLNFYCQMSYCIAKSQRYGSIDVMWPSPSLNNYQPTWEWYTNKAIHKKGTPSCDEVD